MLRRKLRWFGHSEYDDYAAHLATSSGSGSKRARREQNVFPTPAPGNLSDSPCGAFHRMRATPLEDVEAGGGEMLIDTLSSLADGLNVDVTLLFRKRAYDVH